jgi:hypothetical protein
MSIKIILIIFRILACVVLNLPSIQKFSSLKGATIFYLKDLHTSPVLDVAGSPAVEQDNLYPGDLDSSYPAGCQVDLLDTLAGYLGNLASLLHRVHIAGSHMDT